MTDIRSQIKTYISQCQPYDRQEEVHIADAIEWIDSGIEIFRVEKPATPPKHIVAYAVLIDSSAAKILLLEHNLSGRLLSAGGHIDKSEIPHKSAQRELKEELGINSEIYQINPALTEEVPFFVSQLVTVGQTPGHTDVDLWYLFDVNSKKMEIDTDSAEFRREFSGLKWYSFPEVLGLPIERLDPNTHRFIRKLEGIITSSQT